MKVSHLEFDVQPETIVRLDKAEIIEKNPEDSDELRLVDFTE